MKKQLLNLFAVLAVVFATLTATSCGPTGDEPVNPDDNTENVGGEDNKKPEVSAIYFVPPFVDSTFTRPKCLEWAKKEIPEFTLSTNPNLSQKVDAYFNYETKDVQIHYWYMFGILSDLFDQVKYEAQVKILVPSIKEYFDKNYVEVEGTHKKYKTEEVTSEGCKYKSKDGRFFVHYFWKTYDGVNHNYSVWIVYSNSIYAKM